MYKITDRDLAEIRRRHWAMKAQQERDEMARHPEPQIDNVPLVPYTRGAKGGIWL